MTDMYLLCVCVDVRMQFIHYVQWFPYRVSTSFYGRFYSTFPVDFGQTQNWRNQQMNNPRGSDSRDFTRDFLK